MNQQKLGRNDLCSCGSGKKYKQCCMNKAGAKSPQANPGPSKANIALALKQASLAFQSGDMQGAVSLCQNILRVDPSNEVALNLLGILAYMSGQNQVAIQLLNKAVDRKPDYADAHNNLAEVYRASGDVKSAIHHLQTAIKIKPNHIDALVNYGNALQDINEHETSLDMYRQVLDINPKHLGALSNTANLLQQLNRHHEAIEIYQKLIAIDPTYDWALGGLVYSKLNCCLWEDIELDISQINQYISAGKLVIKPFDYLAISDSTEMQQLNARQFSQHQYPSRGINNLANYNNDKIRIAYISADFRQHPVSQLLVNVIERHDRSKFEVIGISLGADDGSAIRARVISAFDDFHDVRSQSDEDVADLLKKLKIDIAVDLMGHTSGARSSIFSYRAALIQVSYLGYAGTTGNDSMDYILADHVVIPEESSKYYSEKVIRLPDTYFPRDSTIVVPNQKSNRADAGLPETGFVFCSFNNHYKINPVMFDVWMRLLSRVDGSVLWLSKANDFVRKNLWLEAERRGVSRDRIIFAERTETLEEHFARHQLADLFLDTLPYNAHTTASDALWAGLPVLTCQGKTFAGRVASSMLMTVDMPEMIAHHLDEYESQALHCAQDAQYMQALKLKLSQNKFSTPVFDTRAYVKNLEDAYVQMLKEQSSG
jgi:predicted O-linked N-acetylglucosamine transferase (SPINDLY family)